MCVARDVTFDHDAGDGVGRRTFGSIGGVRSAGR
jgi:hypothetical protein